mmetsp:Transcript_46461/g.109155  ORF Transcript_46461/g.109155 Transcript_46461/m.109155 type:complete len:778 (-) Transcript_46461:1105-3438(-)
MPVARVARGKGRLTYRVQVDPHPIHPHALDLVPARRGDAPLPQTDSAAIAAGVAHAEARKEHRDRRCIEHVPEVEPVVEAEDEALDHLGDDAAEEEQARAGFEGPDRPVPFQPRVELGADGIGLEERLSARAVGGAEEPPREREHEEALLHRTCEEERDGRLPEELEPLQPRELIHLRSYHRLHALAPPVAGVQIGPLTPSSELLWNREALGRVAEVVGEGEVLELHEPGCKEPEEAQVDHHVGLQPLHEPQVLVVRPKVACEPPVDRLPAALGEEEPRLAADGDVDQGVAVPHHQRHLQVRDAEEVVLLEREVLHLRCELFEKVGALAHDDLGVRDNVIRLGEVAVEHRDSERRAHRIRVLLPPHDGEVAVVAQRSEEHEVELGRDQGHLVREPRAHQVHHALAKLGPEITAIRRRGGCRGCCRERHSAFQLYAGDPDRAFGARLVGRQIFRADRQHQLIREEASLHGAREVAPALLVFRIGSVGGGLEPVVLDGGAVVDEEVDELGPVPLAQRGVQRAVHRRLELLLVPARAHLLLHDLEIVELHGQVEFRLQRRWPWHARRRAVLLVGDWGLPARALRAAEVAHTVAPSRLRKHLFLPCLVFHPAEDALEEGVSERLVASQLKHLAERVHCGRKRILKRLGYVALVRRRGRQEVVAQNLVQLVGARAGGPAARGMVGGRELFDKRLGFRVVVRLHELDQEFLPLRQRRVLLFQLRILKDLDHICDEVGTLAAAFDDERGRVGLHRAEHCLRGPGAALHAHQHHRYLHRVTARRV